MNIFWKVRKFLYKVIPRQKYYFIASVREETVTSPTGKEYKTHDARTWGFFKSKKKAIKAVEENWTDINEAGYYPWAVIGTYEEGLLGQRHDCPELWFEESYRELSIEELKEIEEKYPGKNSINIKTKRAQWNDGTCWQSNFEGYRPCKQPEWAEHFSGWAM